MNDRTTTPGTPRLLRAINDRSALNLLLEHGPLSRVQLGGLTGLSKPTASQLLGRLEEAGLVRHVGSSAGGRGPNAALYAVNAAAGYVAGMDVTVDGATVAVADITGEVVARATTDLAGDADPTPGVKAAVQSVARRAGLKSSELAGLVIGIPGAHDPATDTIRYGDESLAGWARPGRLAALREALGIPVTFENDVNLAAIAERRHGGVAGVGSFALLWVSGGLGMAIDLGGALHRGATGGAGEIGYMPVPPRTGAPAPDFQDLVGAPAVLDLARRLGVPGGDAATAVLTAVAENHEAFLDELAARLATGLATIVAVLDPELVVLTGDVCRAGGEALANRVQSALHAGSPLRPRVVPTAIEGNPVLVGALDAALETARDELFGALDVAQLSRTQTPTRTARS
jgi:predicted NBD/HSP70 family sugar kinase